VRTLLINTNRETMPWPALPLGLCHVASATARAGHDVRFLDLTFARDVKKAVHAAAREFSPDVVGLSVRNLDNCNFERPHFYLEAIRDEVVRTVRGAAPDARLVLGGSAVNVAPAHALAYLEADYACVGDGEAVFPALLTAWDRGAGEAGIPGVLASPALRPIAPRGLPVLDSTRPPADGSRIDRGGQLEDLSENCWSEPWRWVDLPRYRRAGGPYSIQTKRGCALKCSYCVYNQIEGRTYRLRPAKDVCDELEVAVRQYGVTDIEFVDSTFNLPLAHARAVCEELASRRLPARLSTMGLNPAGITEDLLKHMRRAGFHSVMCTPESASNVTLKTLQKGYGKDKVIEAARLLRAAELPTYWFFLLGAPGETLATVRETLAFCEEHVRPTDVVLFSMGLRVYPGTPLERTCKERGWFEADDPLFFPSWYLSPELDLTELYTLLVSAARAHPNWMVNAETVMTPFGARLLKGLLKTFGRDGPFWHHLPDVFRLVGRFGARQKGLEEHFERVTRDLEIRHRA
jgi:radical SAM superfamily enzyme YgiQ (UPF0313 family)